MSTPARALEPGSPPGLGRPEGFAARLAARADLFARATAYELRRVSILRARFLVAEVFRGTARPLAALFVFHALYAAGGPARIGGLDWRDVLRFMVLVALLEKLVFHDRALDLSLQIFEGYVTKYLVMPVDYTLLCLARFAQFLLVQLAVVPLLWAVGLVLAPQWWPRPASATALAQAATLVLLGSYCHLLFYFLVHALAFWLDVVWSLLVMARFLALFAAGAVLPPRMMPEAFERVLAWLFPYWTLAGPIELLEGRLHTPDFLRGLGVLGASALALWLARRALWRAGLRRYTGSGM